MQVTITVHIHPAPDQFATLLAQGARILAALQHQKESLMTVSSQIAAFSARVNTATNEIAADLQALRDKITTGGSLSEADAAVLDGIATRLEVMGVDPENPVPETPPTE